MTVLRFAAALLVIAACNQSRWVETHATQIHVGAWVADIPEHWRDIHELREPVKGLGVPGGRTLIYDSYRDVGQIDVFPMINVRDGEGCKAFADLVREQSKGTGNDVQISNEQAATFSGDLGCLMQLSVQGQHGLLVIRTHAGQAVAVRCLGKDAHLDGSGGCDKVVYGLRVGA